MPDYQSFHQNLVGVLAEKVSKETYFSNENTDDTEFLSKLKTLSENALAEDENGPIGQWLINRVVSHYPQLMGIIPRELLWFFGGTCLHYLGEEEVYWFQKVEEAYFEQGNNESFAQLLTRMKGFR